MDSKEQDFAFDSMGPESMNAAEPENADGTKPGDGGFTAGDRMGFNEIRDTYEHGCEIYGKVVLLSQKKGRGR